MRNLILLVILTASLSLHGQPVLNADSVQSALGRLDKAIEQKYDYRSHRHSHPDSLRLVVTMSEGRQLVDTYLELADHYSRIQTDSALYYLNQVVQTTEYKQDKDLQQRVAIRYADVYAVVGLYTTATETLRSIDLSRANAETRKAYFHACRTVYGWMTDYASLTDVAQTYRDLTQQYRDSILTYEQPGIGRDIVLADRYLSAEQPDSALAILFADLPRAEGTERAYIYYNIAESYRQKGMPDAYEYYLALTARDDIERGVNEYAALPILATLLFEQGDINRAYAYMTCSMEDANYCKARLRSLEAGNIFPIIDRAYNNKVKEQRRRERIFLYTLALLALLLVAAIFYLRRLTRKVASSRRQLARANRVLTQTDKLKEEYIAYYLGECRSYIESFDTFRRSLLRMAKHKQTDDLLKELIKSDSLVEDEQQRFLSQFDKAFLDLHPQFVERFNAMLRPEARIELRRRDTLTTELRIFALIRLGVSDTAEIAKFLNYSTATIYNYRSRVRNTSIYNKEEFEQRLMAL